MPPESHPKDTASLPSAALTLLDLIDKHGAARWETGVAERTRATATAKAADKLAVNLRAEIVEAIASLPSADKPACAACSDTGHIAVLGSACRFEGCRATQQAPSVQPEGEAARLTALLERLREKCAEAAEQWPERAAAYIRSIELDVAVRSHLAAAPAPQAAPREPDMRAVVEALGFDPENHHNAAKCPYCRAQGQQVAPAVQPVGAIVEMNYTYSDRRVVWKDGMPQAGTVLFPAAQQVASAPTTEGASRWPDGLLDRIKAAEQRIADNSAPRRIPADPHGDVDLVLAEVRYLIEGNWPPFWIKDATPASAGEKQQ